MSSPTDLVRIHVPGERPWLRVYDPWECDPNGEPAGWEVCQTCHGDRYVPGRRLPYDDDRYRLPCPDCGGHGSLRAAAAALLEWHDADCPMRNEHGGPCVCVSSLRHSADHEHRDEHVETVRCYACGHPSSPPTWDPAKQEDDSVTDLSRWARMHLGASARAVLEGHGPYEPPGPTPWTACDPGCRHDPHGVREDGGVAARAAANAGEVRLNMRVLPHPVEASWRDVDVRRLGHAHDLRPDRLALLCTRCDVAR